MHWIRSIYCLLPLFCSHQILGVNFHDFDSYQSKLTHGEVASKISTFLEKEPGIKKFYQLTPTSLIVGDLENQQIDYILKLHTAAPHPLKKDSASSLKNKKIAIDPGHFGGDFAELEQRFVSLPEELSKSGQPIRFCEGDLTYLTALELQRLLENKGAEVFITRPEIGKGVIKQDFTQWLEEHPDVKGSSRTQAQIFRGFYNTEDLIERARVINDFSPDITIVIHYNADLTAEEKEQKSLTTKNNYCLAFIPGAFQTNELKRAEARYEFLRLIVTDHLEKSLRLSGCITQQFVKQLGLPLISEEIKTSYTTNACIRLAHGIYSRNLVLTRLIHSPLCYGETLIQNNEEEVYTLAEPESRSKRILQVAQAYFEGIEDYFQNPY